MASAPYRANDYRVDLDTGCWVWTHTERGNGYGELWEGNRRWQAHRRFYEVYNGSISEGLVIDHLCRNTLCVNPAHLEAVTPAENILRGTAPPAKNARKTHCPKGHPYIGDNVYVSAKGGRACRSCDLERTNARRELRKERGLPVVAGLSKPMRDRLWELAQYGWRYAVPHQWRSFEGLERRGLIRFVCESGTGRVYELTDAGHEECRRRWPGLAA